MSEVPLYRADCTITSVRSFYLLSKITFSPCEAEPILRWGSVYVAYRVAIRLGLRQHCVHVRLGFHLDTINYKTSTSREWISRSSPRLSKLNQVTFLAKKNASSAAWHAYRKHQRPKPRPTLVSTGRNRNNPLAAPIHGPTCWLPDSSSWSACTPPGIARATRRAPHRAALKRLILSQQNRKCTSGNL